MRAGDHGRALLLTSPDTLGWRWGAPGFLLIISWARICYRRRSIPPRDRRGAVIPKGLRRWIRRRAVWASGLSPAHAARNTERLPRLPPSLPFPSARVGRRRRARNPRRGEYLSLSAYFVAPVSGVFGALPKYGGFCHYGRWLYRRDVLPSTLVHIAPFGPLGSTGRRPRPRIFTNVAVYWARRCAAKLVATPAAEIEYAAPAANSPHRQALRANCKGPPAMG